jgi:hypothetical protein
VSTFLVLKWSGERERREVGRQLLETAVDCRTIVRVATSALPLYPKSGTGAIIEKQVLSVRAIVSHGRLFLPAIWCHDADAPPCGEAQRWPISTKVVVL